MQRGVFLAPAVGLVVLVGSVMSVAQAADQAAPPGFAPAPPATTPGASAAQPGPAPAPTPDTPAAAAGSAPPPAAPVRQAVDSENGDQQRPASPSAYPQPHQNPYQNPRPSSLRATSDTLPARVGFQMAVRLNLAVPTGQADAGEDMSDFFSTQAGFLIEMGGKSSEHLYIGGLFGYARGGVSGSLQDLCTTNAISCDSSSYVVGAEMQYHISPGQQVNPWLGLGIAYESASVQLSGPGGSGDVTLSGLQFPRSAFGIDVRASDAFGIGGFIEAAFGDYLSIGSSFPSVPGGDIPSQSQTKHMWLTLGARLVLFP